MNNDNTDKVISSFLDLIKKMREKKELTREELANKAGVHKTTIGLLERHKRIPTIQVAMQIANALETTLSAMMKKAEKK